MGSMQGIESMEEFLLGTFLTYNKLYVIDHENIHVTVFLTQLGHGSRITTTNGFDYFVCEFLTGNVENLFVRILF